jgi:ABC-type Co2+ transport system permease subunit
MPPSDLEQLAADWQAIDAPGPAPDAIRRFVGARTRVLRAWIAGEVLVGAVAILVLGYFGWTTEDRRERLVMISLAIVTAAMMAASRWIWTGVIDLQARNTAEYVALSLERLRRMKQACWAGWAALTAEVVLFALWIPNRAGGSENSAFAWALLAGMTVAAAVFLRSLRWWIARDERRLSDIRRDMED